MELFGLPIVTVYLYALIISGVLTFLYILFADVLHIDTGDLHFLNPVLILAFITFLSASGYLFERLTSLHYLLILGISAVISFILVTLLNVFILVPLSSAEESLVYKESDLRGRIGKVITPIPVDGYGEVIIENASGRIAKPAKSFDGEAIQSDTKVLVVQVKNGVLEVTVNQELESFL
ncbi:NfeD family protein [Neobacillus niacini]|uniref:NfeD family protein n=1 Tax=Neobacillus niacini TaxID=86668 RepID=UPI0021CB371E|nr:NfeD family protein [Neobacillus niacini]MCM3765828.1 NfeD family protein [Neobacillus niacini]